MGHCRRSSFLFLWSGSELGRGRNQENAAVSDRDEGRRGRGYLRNDNNDNGFITVSRSDLPIVSPGAAFGAVH